MRQQICLVAVVGEANSESSCPDNRLLYIIKNAAKQLVYATEACAFLTSRDFFYCMLIKLVDGQLIVRRQPFAVGTVKNKVTGVTVFEWRSHARVCAVLHKHLKNVRSMKLGDVMKAEKVFVRDPLEERGYVGPKTKCKPFEKYTPVWGEHLPENVFSTQKPVSSGANNVNDMYY